MIERRAALLRGINVGRAKRIAMADLRELFEGLGYKDVRTLLNSGNVVYSSGKPLDGEGVRIEKAIASAVGFTTSVTIVTGPEIAAAVEKNPLRRVAKDPARLLLFVAKDSKALTAAKPLLDRSWAPEALALERRIAYLWCAEGIVESRLWAAMNKLIGDAGTARNITTMTKLLDLVQEKQVANRGSRRSTDRGSK
jgi:uncharacterized protein (DUF1697 family)